MSIRPRLLLLVLFATLVPALVGGMQFLERRDAEIAEARHELVATALRTAQVLRDTVRATAQLEYGLSRARDLDTRDRAACSAFLADVLKEYPQYLSILAFAPDGSRSLPAVGARGRASQNDLPLTLTSLNIRVFPCLARAAGL